MRKDKGEVVGNDEPTGVHVGEMISIYWDGDRQWYNGKVLSYDEGSKECKVLYEDGELEQVNLKETKYRIIRNRNKDVNKKLILEDGGPELEEAELMKHIGKLLLDCEDRLPLEAVRSTCKLWWQDWRKETAAAAKNGDVNLLADSVRTFTLQLKPSVTTAWWKSQNKEWRDALKSVNSSSELQIRVKELLTKAVDWACARELFLNTQPKKDSSVEVSPSYAYAGELTPRRTSRRMIGSSPGSENVGEKLSGFLCADGSLEVSTSYVYAEESISRRTRRRISASTSLKDSVGEKLPAPSAEVSNSGAKVGKMDGRKKIRRPPIQGFVIDQVNKKCLGSPRPIAFNTVEPDFDPNSLSSSYATDSDFKNIYCLLNKDQSLLNTEESASILSYSLHDGLLFMNKRLCIIKDIALRKQLISKFHTSSESGHLGNDKTLDALRSKYYWHDLESDVQNHISQCSLCQHAKETSSNTQDIPVQKQASQMWQTVFIKLLTGLPVSLDGYDGVLLVMDTLSKQAHFLRCGHDFTPQRLAQLYFKEVVRLHGIPKAMLCDAEVLSQNKSWNMLWESFGVTICFDSSQCSDVNQTLEKLLRMHAESQQQRWSDSLHLLELAYNISSSIDTSHPLKTIHGFELDASQPFPKETLKDASASKFVKKVKNFLTVIRQSLAAATAQQGPSTNPTAAPLQEASPDPTATPQQEPSPDPTVCASLFKVGEQVVMRISPDLFGTNGLKNLSLRTCYSGPFQVNAVLGGEMYEVDIPDGWEMSKVVHSDFLRPYSGIEDHIKAHEVRVTSELGGQIELEPESILGTRFKWDHGNTVLEYLIHWRGLSSDKATWESDMSARRFSLDEFLNPQSS